MTQTAELLTLSLPVCLSVFDAFMTVSLPVIVTVIKVSK